MGNRSGCSLFSGEGNNSSTLKNLLGYSSARSGLDKMWIDGLTEEENRVIKEIYVNMGIAS